LLASFWREARCDASKNSPLFEIGRVLVHFDHNASGIVNADQRRQSFERSNDI
jgi:hypothetical protein